jgi:hypothetical protein
MQPPQFELNKVIFAMFGFLSARVLVHQMQLNYWRNHD